MMKTEGYSGRFLSGGPDGKGMGIKMRTAFLCVLLCAFLNGCGKGGELVLISSTEETSEDIRPGENFQTEENTAPEGKNIPPEQNTGDISGQNENGFPQDKEGVYEKEAAEESLCVYVCGAVAFPGVVELPQGSRADDALRAAGGFLEGAQENYVNLAARVEDGQMLYFPTVEEAEELVLHRGGPAEEKENQENGIVNLNTADAAQLCTLPGIGEARAADIIAYREANGPFGTPEDIMKVPGIKQNAYEKLKDKIRTY